MKITKFILTIAIIGMAISCNKEEEKASTSEELKANAQMDVISDDVSKIVEDQYDAQFAASGKTSVGPARSCLSMAGGWRSTGAFRRRGWGVSVSPEGRRRLRASGAPPPAPETAGRRATPSSRAVRAAT